MNNKIAVFCVFITFIMSGCEDVVAAKEKIFWHKILITIELNKVKPAKQDKDAVSLVYGSIKAQGKNQNIKNINLDCISLDIDGAQSEKLYVDSVAHILTSNYVVKNNNLSVDVYWKFNQHIDYNDLKYFNFYFNESDLESCVILTEAAR